MKVGEMGIIRMGKGWGFRQWEHSPEHWEVVVDDGHGLENPVIAPSRLYDRETKKHVANPDFLDIEVTYSVDCEHGYSDETTVVEVPLEALVEALRRSGYRVERETKQ